MEKFLASNAQGLRKLNHNYSQGIMDAQSARSFVDSEKVEVMDHIAGIIVEISARQKDIEIPKETGQDRSEIETQLEQLAEGRRLTLEKMMETLIQLPGVAISFPNDSINRAKASREAIFANPEKVRMIVKGAKKIKDNTEGNKAPVIQDPWPEKIVVDGETLDFSFKTLHDIMLKVRQADHSFISLFDSNYVPAAIKTTTWGSKVGIWTSACLAGSKNRHYDTDQNIGGITVKSQLNYQKELMGEGYEIHEDMILAMMLHYLSSRKTEKLMLEDWMRLNTRGPDGAPLGVGSDDDDLCLTGASRSAYLGSGVGAFLGISS